MKAAVQINMVFQNLYEKSWKILYHTVTSQILQNREKLPERLE